MKRYSIFLLAIISINMVSCKLDSITIPPGLGPNNGQTVQGITIDGRNINNSLLTGTWAVAYTVEQHFNAHNVVIAGTIVPNKFGMITLNEQLKSISVAGNAAATGTYLLALNHNVFFINTPTDLFGRSFNSPVRITYLNKNSMTWLALEPDSVIFNNQKAARGYEVIFNR